MLKTGFIGLGNMGLPMRAILSLPDMMSPVLMYLVMLATPWPARAGRLPQLWPKR